MLVVRTTASYVIPNWILKKEKAGKSIKINVYSLMNLNIFFFQCSPVLHLNWQLSS